MIRQPRYIKRVQNIVLPFFLVFSFFITKPLFAQERGFVILDSLRNMSYEELEISFNNNINNNQIAEVYAKKYVEKGNREKDTMKIIEGYLLLINLHSDTDTAIKYADSIIDKTGYSKNREYQAEGFLQKGIQMYYLSMNTKSLTNLVKANELFSQNKFKQLQVHHYIGLLKNKEGNEKGALSIFRKNLTFFKNDSIIEKYRAQYLKSLYALSDSYNRNNEIDSAAFFSKKGIIESLKGDYNDIYPYFVISYGLSNYYKDQNNIALDSLLKGSNLIRQNKVALCDVYSFISEIHKKENRETLAVKYLLKIDSIYSKNPEVYFQAKSAYKSLLKVYKKTNNSEEQIQIISKLIQIDSLITINNKELGKNIIKEYETPKLLKEKENLINKLEKTKIDLSKKLFLVFIALILTLGGILFLFNKNRNYKNKYDELLKSRKDKKSKVDSKPKTIDSISEEQVARIIEQLNKFEKNLDFLSKEISLAKTSSSLGTNSSYLSKVINHYKGKNFSGYINELRIEYALEIIPGDKRLLNYTITALANEFGYNNSESFSKAFFARTGIYPSYFIKQLKKQENETA